MPDPHGYAYVLPENVDNPNPIVIVPPWPPWPGDPEDPGGGTWCNYPPDAWGGAPWDVAVHRIDKLRPRWIDVKNAIDTAISRLFGTVAAGWAAVTGAGTDPGSPAQLLVNTIGVVKVNYTVPTSAQMATYQEAIETLAVLWTDELESLSGADYADALSDIVYTWPAFALDAFCKTDWTNAGAHNVQDTADHALDLWEFVQCIRLFHVTPLIIQLANIAYPTVVDRWTTTGILGKEYLGDLTEEIPPPVDETDLPTWTDTIATLDADWIQATHTSKYSLIHNQANYKQDGEGARWVTGGRQIGRSVWDIWTGHYGGSITAAHLLDGTEPSFWGDTIGVSMYTHSYARARRWQRTEADDTWVQPVTGEWLWVDYNGNRHSPKTIFDLADTGESMGQATWTDDPTGYSGTGEGNWVWYQKNPGDVPMYINYTTPINTLNRALMVRVANDAAGPGEYRETAPFTNPGGQPGWPSTIQDDERQIETTWAAVAMLGLQGDTADEGVRVVEPAKFLWPFLRYKKFDT